VLEGADLGWIGQLDIVMVPVDGGYTMDQAAMVETLNVLKARLILPMHYFGQSTLARFLSALDESFDVETSDGRRSPSHPRRCRKPPRYSCSQDTRRAERPRGRQESGFKGISLVIAAVPHTESLKLSRVQL
jgi:hypothetical protein